MMRGVNAAHTPGPGDGTARARGWPRLLPIVLTLVLGVGASLIAFVALRDHVRQDERQELEARVSTLLPLIFGNFQQIDALVGRISILADAALETESGEEHVRAELVAGLGSVLTGAAVVDTRSLAPAVVVGSLRDLGSLPAAQRALEARGLRTGPLAIVERRLVAGGVLIAAAGAAGPGRDYGVYVETVVPTVAQAFVTRGIRFGLYVPNDDVPANLVFSSEGIAPPEHAGPTVERDLQLPGLSLRVVTSSTGPLVEAHHRALPWIALTLGLLITGLIASLVEAMRSARDTALGLVREVEARNAELDEAEHRFGQLVERLPVATYTDRAEPGAPSVYMSPQVESFLGVRPEEFEALGTSWAEMIHPDDRARVLAEIDEHLETGEPFRSEYQMIRRDGVVVWLRDVSVIDTVDGTQVINGFWEDITERKALEAQLLTAQRLEAVGRLAGGISHDFNNILNVIAVSADFLLEATPPGDERREDVEEIRRAADRAAGLTRQLVAFSRRQVLHPERIDVNAVIHTMERTLRLLLGADVALALQLARDPCWVEVDPGQLEQVIVNLVVNARDAMPTGGMVTISTEPSTRDDGERILALVVSDTGHGVDESLKDRIFEPFFTTKDPDKGSGLGLASVYGIVRQSGGTVTVARGVEGRGAMFRVELPCALALEGSTSPLTPRPAATRAGVRVLLVEDNDDVRRATTRIVEQLGHQVRAASDGKEALDLVERAGAPDILVTDVLMPQIGGIELVARLRMLYPALPVVFTSGYPGAEHEGTIVTDERTIFLQKPFGPGELEHAVTTLADVATLTD